MNVVLLLNSAIIMSSMIQSIPASSFPANMEIIDDYEEYFEEEVSSMPQPYLYDDECITDYYQDYDYSVFIDPTLPKKDGTQCNLQKIEKKITVVCSDINLALQFHRNSTVYVLASGANITHYLKENENTTFFEAISDVAFVGNVTTETAHVECLSGAGLAFQNVNRIRLQNIEFCHCGALRPSTSKNFTTSSLEEIMVSLYFYNCTSVTMCGLTVQHSTNALGVCMYDTDGTVSVYNSSFVNNTVQDDGAVPVTGGGGFVVEFSYCIPGDLVCNSTNHQTTHNSNSNYVFFRSNFTDNAVEKRETIKHVLPNKVTHDIHGQGGGLAILFKSNAYNNTILLTGCQFSRNKALFGGGLYIGFADESINNKVDVINNLFLKNTCYHSTNFATSGGAIRILSLLDFDLWYTLGNSTVGNSVFVSSCFIDNYAFNGGAISYSPANQKVLLQHTTSLKITDSVFYKNYGRLGAAVHLKLLQLITGGIINHVLIENCTFQHNKIKYDTQESSYEIGIGSVYTYQIPLNIRSHVSFTNNVGTALAIIETYADFCNSTSSFLKNAGDTGGAVALVGSSHVVVNDNTEVYFAYNFARVGGAIYNYDLSLGVSKSCFIRYDDPFLDRRQWKASFTFINNTSNGVASSNSIYSSSVYPCTLRNIEAGIPLNEILLFCKPYWNFVDSDCMSQIGTQGNTYEFKNGSTLSSFPGKGFELPITVFDDLGHDITNSVGYTSVIALYDSAVAQVDPKYTLTSGNFLVITGEENTTVSLELHSSESRPHLVRVNVDLLICPPGFQFTAPCGDQNSTDDSLGMCKCHSTDSYRSKLNCSMTTFRAQIPRNYWIGIDPSDSESSELVMSLLPNLYTETVLHDRYYFDLPRSRAELDESICGIRNRTGPVCGKCKEGYSTAVNSYFYICTACNDDTNFVKNILLYIIFAFLPYVILLGGIVYFNLKFTSSAVTGFILFAQMISIDIYDISGGSSFSSDMYQSYHFVYGIFNFNSFANLMDPFCIGKNHTSLDILRLEYVLAALPLLVIVIILVFIRLKRFQCLCCRKWNFSVQSPRNPVRSHSKKMRYGDRPMLHAIVTFTLLSYTKLSVVSMKILATQEFFNESGHNVGGVRVFLAGHLSFSSKEYLFPYGIIAIFFIVLVMIPPLFLLGLTQLVDRLLDHKRFACFRKVWPTLIIHAFLDAFQGYYKPNRRFFSGIYFVFRLFIAFAYVYAIDYLTQYALQQLAIVVMIALLAIFKPYRREVFNIVDILIFLNIFFINTITSYVYASSLSIGGLNKDTSMRMYITQYCLLWLPLVYMLTYVSFKIVVRVGLYQYVVRKVKNYRLKLRHSSSRDLLYSDVYSNNSVDRNSEDLDGLSVDSALFKCAEDRNRFAWSGGGKKPTTLVSVVSGKEGTEEKDTGIETGSVST